MTRPWGRANCWPERRAGDSGLDLPRDRGALSRLVLGEGCCERQDGQAHTARGGVKLDSKENPFLTTERQFLKACSCRLTHSNLILPAVCCHAHFPNEKVETFFRMRQKHI